jgi:hypothetical protein
MNHLDVKVTEGKLSTSESNSLVNYVKLLSEVQKAEEKARAESAKRAEAAKESKTDVELLQAISSNRSV